MATVLTGKWNTVCDRVDGLDFEVAAKYCARGAAAAVSVKAILQPARPWRFLWLRRRPSIRAEDLRLSVRVDTPNGKRDQSTRWTDSGKVSVSVEVPPARIEGRFRRRVVPREFETEYRLRFVVAGREYETSGAIAVEPTLKDRPEASATF